MRITNPKPNAEILLHASREIVVSERGTGSSNPSPSSGESLAYLRRAGMPTSDVEELLAERGLDVSYETVRLWVLKFGPVLARRLALGF